MLTISVETMSLIIGLILSIITLLGMLFKVFRKIDKIDKIDTLIDEVGGLKEEIIKLKSLSEEVDEINKKSEERKIVLYELKDTVHDISIQLDEVKEETRFNTSMNKADTEVLEALADHAIKTQGANGKVHRSLEMIEKLKFNNPKFS